MICFVIVYHQYLAHLAGITVKLQRTTIDIVEAHAMSQEVAAFYRKQRKDCDTDPPGTDASHIYVQSVSMAGNVCTNAEMPRISSNAET